MKQIFVCITGGHLTPALSVIEEIQRTRPDWNMMFVGRRQVFEGEGGISQEERLVREKGVPFYGLTTGRFQRIWSPLSLLSLVKIPAGIVSALLLLMRYHPSHILSFGGYIALPVALAGAMLHIPIVTHEQTGRLGLANAIIARIAKKVLLARDVGVPMRHALIDGVRSPRPSFLPDTKLPLIYVTGGSTGAQSLNQLLYPLLPALCKSIVVIHQVGERNIETARRERDKLPVEQGKNYIPIGYIDVGELSWIYHHASLVIGRSGANTTAEVSALGIPALFIPLPWAADYEQQKNARILADKGMAVVLDQQTLSGETLLIHIKKMLQSIKQYKKSAMHAASFDRRNGAANVVKTIEGSIAITNHS